MPPPLALLSQYAPAQSRIGRGNTPFGRAVAAPSSLGAFNPFPAGSSELAPRYTPTLHSPDKRLLHSVVGRDSASEVRRSLKALLEQPLGTPSSNVTWTFTDVHSGSKHVRAFAKLSCLLAIHDVQWSGTVPEVGEVPEQWKLFPGPLFDQFRDRVFSPASSPTDVIEWLRSEYRQDVQERPADRRLRPKIANPFWRKELFDAFRLGQWGFAFPLSQRDIDSSFTIFAFLLSVDSAATWPPRIPADGLTVASMAQLGRNILWFFDLALAQPGQSGSLFLDFSLFGEAMARLFDFLDHHGLADQWDATPDSRRRHTYAFLFWIHRLLAEMQQWFTSVPLVFYATPSHQPQSSVMVLSPTIANRHGTRGNLWAQRSDWLQIVAGIFRDQFDSSETLRSAPPSWIIRSSARMDGLATLSDPIPFQRIPVPDSLAQGKQPSGSRKATRHQTQSPAPAPAPDPTPASPDAPITTYITTYPLVAFGPKVSVNARMQQPARPGNVLYQATKALGITAPKYGPASESKYLCFNYLTESSSKCDGIFPKSSRTQKTACNRLHVCLSPTNPHRNDPPSYFAGLVHFLQSPGVSDYFIPTDAFATSPQFWAALSPAS